MVCRLPYSTACAVTSGWAEIHGGRIIPGIAELMQRVPHLFDRTQSRAMAHHLPGLIRCEIASARAWAQGLVDADRQNAQRSSGHAPRLYACERSLPGCEEAECVEAGGVRLLVCTHARAHLRVRSMLGRRDQAGQMTRQGLGCQSIVPAELQRLLVEHCVGTSDRQQLWTPPGQAGMVGTMGLTR